MISHRFFFLFGLVLLGAVSSLFAKSVKLDSTITPVSFEQQVTKNQTLAHKMMGHINLAQLALELKLFDDAKDQLNKAKRIEFTLTLKSPTLSINSWFKYGKVRHLGTKTIAMHYIPMIDELFLVSDYLDVYKRNKEIEINETSAGVVHVGIFVNLNEIKAVLDATAVAVSVENYDKALGLLKGVFNEAIFHERQVDDLVLAMAENINLAQTYIENQRYDSARFTLKHVQDLLKKNRKSKRLSLDQALVDSFNEDFFYIRQSLQKKDPAQIKSVGDKLRRWSDMVSLWLYE